MTRACFLSESRPGEDFVVRALICAYQALLSSNVITLISAWPVEGEVEISTLPTDPGVPITILVTVVPNYNALAATVRKRMGYALAGGPGLGSYNPIRPRIFMEVSEANRLCAVALDVIREWAVAQSRAVRVAPLLRRDLDPMGTGSIGAPFFTARSIAAFRAPTRVATSFDSSLPCIDLRGIPNVGIAGLPPRARAEVVLAVNEAYCTSPCTTPNSKMHCVELQPDLGDRAGWRIYNRALGLAQCGQTMAAQELWNVYRYKRMPRGTWAVPACGVDPASPWVTPVDASGVPIPMGSPTQDFLNGAALGREDVRRARTGIVVWMPRWLPPGDYTLGYRAGVVEAGGAIYPTVGGYRIAPYAEGGAATSAVPFRRSP